MNQFLSNIVSRHGGNESVIRPRGKNIFEPAQPLSSSLEVHSEVNDFNPIVRGEKISEERIEKPQWDEPLKNQLLNDPVVPKIDPVISDKKVGFVKKSSPSIPDQTMVEKEILRVDKSEVKIEKDQLKVSPKNKAILNSPLNQLQEQKLEEEPSILDSKEEPSTKENPVSLERITVQPSQAITAELISNLNNHHTRIEMNTESNHTVESTNTAPSPTIKIHIGRIDIKAMKPSVGQIKKMEKTKASTMSLDQFLKKRKGI